MNRNVVPHDIRPSVWILEGLRERTEHLDIFIFPPITQWCSIAGVLFTGGRSVSNFSVLKIKIAVFLKNHTNSIIRLVY